MTLLRCQPVTALQDRRGRNGLVPRAGAWVRSLNQIVFGGSRCHRLYADTSGYRQVHCLASRSMPSACACVGDLSLQHLASHHHALDLVGALVDLDNLGLRAAPRQGPTPPGTLRTSPNDATDTNYPPTEPTQRTS